MSRSRLFRSYLLSPESQKKKRFLNGVRCSDFGDNVRQVGGRFGQQSYPLVQADLAVKRRTGGNFGLQHKLSITVQAAGVSVTPILLSSVHLQQEIHTRTNS